MKKKSKECTQRKIDFVPQRVNQYAKQWLKDVKALAIKYGSTHELDRDIYNVVEDGRKIKIFIDKSHFGNDERISTSGKNYLFLLGYYYFNTLKTLNFTLSVSIYADNEMEITPENFTLFDDFATYLGFDAKAKKTTYFHCDIINGEMSCTDPGEVEWTKAVKI